MLILPELLADLESPWPTLGPFLPGEVAQRLLSFCTADGDTLGDCIRKNNN